MATKTKRREEIPLREATPTRDRGEVFYRKVGRRYQPVGYGELPMYKPGYYLVRVEEGCTSTSSFEVDPDFGETEHALRCFEDVLCKELLEASRLREDKRRPLTKKEREGWEAYQKIVGEEATLWLERASMSEIAEKALDVFRQKYVTG